MASRAAISHAGPRSMKPPAGGQGSLSCSCRRDRAKPQGRQEAGSIAAASGIVRIMLASTHEPCLCHPVGPMTVEEYMGIPDGPSGERYECRWRFTVDGPAIGGSWCRAGQCGDDPENHLRGKGLPCSVITEAGPRAAREFAAQCALSRSGGSPAAGCGAMNHSPENVVLAVEILSRSKAHATPQQRLRLHHHPEHHRNPDRPSRRTEGGTAAARCRWRLAEDGVTLAAPERLTLESISLSLPIAQLYEGLA